MHRIVIEVLQAIAVICSMLSQTRLKWTKGEIKSVRVSFKSVECQDDFSSETSVSSCEEIEPFLIGHVMARRFFK